MAGIKAEILNIKMNHFCTDRNKIMMRWVWLHSEAFSTTTCPLYIRIVKDEFTCQFCLHKVHLCAQDRQLCFGINQQFHT